MSRSAWPRSSVQTSPGSLERSRFDEFILGYGDRRAMLAAEFAGRIVPGGNGVFRPTVVSDGRVVGTWKRTGSGKQRTFAVEPFTTDLRR